VKRESYKDFQDRIFGEIARREKRGSEEPTAETTGEAKRANNAGTELGASPRHGDVSRRFPPLEMNKPVSDENQTVAWSLLSMLKPIILFFLVWAAWALAWSVFFVVGDIAFGKAPFGITAGAVVALFVAAKVLGRRDRQRKARPRQ